MSPLDQLNPMQQYLVHEFVEDYEDGIMSRRDMLNRVIHITGSVTAATALLAAMGVRATGAQEPTAAPSPAPQSPLAVPVDDPRVASSDITFPGSDDETLLAYQAAPSGEMAAAPLPLILVCHENRGLTDHIRDVTRRFATNGYLACAIDLLSRQGGTAAVDDPSEIPALLTEGDPDRHVSAFQAAIDHYRNDPQADIANIGMNGYCFGGGITWRAATQIADLKAAAPFYGPPPSLDAVPDIQAAVFAVYSDDPSDFANNGRGELKAALEDAGVTFEFKVYPNTQHAFHNDTGQRYNEDQAISAWNDMLAWFARYLGGSNATPIG